MVEAGAKPKKTCKARCGTLVFRQRWTSMPSSSPSHSGVHWQRCRRWSSRARQSRLHRG